MTRFTTRAGLVAAIAVVVCAGALQAQVQEPPPRESRGTLGGRPGQNAGLRQSLVFSGNLMGGFDDSLTQGSTLSTPLFTPYSSSYAMYGSGNLQYRAGGETRGLAVSTGGFTQRYLDSPVPLATYGADLSASGNTPLGRRTRLSLGQGVRYAPSLNPQMFVTAQGAPFNPNTNPTNGLAARKSIDLSSNAKVTREWTRRTRTDLGYSFSNHRIISGAGFDTVMHSVRLSIDHSIGRSAGLRAGASRSVNEHVLLDGTSRPLTILNVDGGFRYERNLSRTRVLALSAGAGASTIETQDYFTGDRLEYMTPSLSANASFDVARSWTLTGDYTRSVTVLQGASAQGFVSQTVSLNAGGFSGRRIEVVFGGAYASGYIGGALSSVALTNRGHIGQYSTYTGTGQVRVRLSQQLSTVVVVNHLRYDLDAAAANTIGVGASNLRRSSARIGLNWSLPVVRTR